MTSSAPSKLPDTVGALMRQRLVEIGKSAAELAEAIGVPPEYVEELIVGSRRPPLPGRTDIYLKMTSFLRLGRSEVTSRAIAERASEPPTGRTVPRARVRELVMALCEPKTAKKLEQRRTKTGDTEMAGFVQRLLDVAQGSVRRALDDQVGLRVEAQARGTTYPAMRLRVLEFLDVTADTLSAEDLVQFVQPRILRWDVDFDTGVLRVVMHPKGPRASTPHHQSARRA
jgi:hypothetical protein